ncbi:ATP11 protein-domain-containing protein [Pisolithus croceorrhizus]|nr:ATP11 protein-domain-containing protein [Pisolithus croceorrhizus]
MQTNSSQKAKQRGVDLDELKVQARQEAHRRQKEEAETASVRKFHPKTTPCSRWSYPIQQQRKTPPGPRKDSSPIKVLTGHTTLRHRKYPALWTAYHASRSGGTGRGYICASLPLEAYNRMTNVAKRYPSFVLPSLAHEFFYLQWDFYSAPPVPLAPSCTALPPVSTDPITPLQEYKHRGSFATPYLVLTFHTDLSHSHDLVLLRGEITPSAAVTDAKPGRDIVERYLLSQVDAQLLAMGLQEYYLWDKEKGGEERDSTAEELLRRFHERPDDFDWQELLKRSVMTA